MAAAGSPAVYSAEIKCSWISDRWTAAETYRPNTPETPFVLRTWTGIRFVRGRRHRRAIRLARHARGWRQADLGHAAGYSASTIFRLETGQRAWTDLHMLRRIADVVGIPSQVLGALVGIGPPAPARLAAPAGPQAEEDDPMRRRTLIAAGLAVPLQALTRLDDALAVLPSPTTAATPAEITARLARARRLYDTGDLNRLVTGLPDVLAAAHTAAEHSNHPAGYACVAACYDLATDTLNKIGRTAASRITADRATAYAGLSGSPIAMAAAARSLGIVLRHEERRPIADRVTLHAANRLEATGLTTPALAAAYAQILCTCAYNAAQAGDRHRALELIGDAEHAARLPTSLADRPFAITPAQVSLYKVGVHWSLGDAGSALHAGRNLHPGQFATSERRGRLHTDLARAWWQWRKPEQTTRALLAAYRQAPAEVRDRPSIRKIVTQLARDHPRVAGVRELATAIGHHSK
jgi:transcriptional regulator with XRE-family HTH domain